MRVVVLSAVVEIVPNLVFLPRLSCEDMKYKRMHLELTASCGCASLEIP